MHTLSDIHRQSFTLPAARLGPENPLPPIVAGRDLHVELAVDPSVPAEDREGLGWGMPPSPLPYRMQDDYDRVRAARTFQAVVLENEHLRATFLPEVGGRLWSLVHRASGRELLARNPVFQPCNLAIRNAWVSGGVEWNLGWTGHWPLTCSPLFAAPFELPDGTPGLRMWEWERLRQVPFQIDAWLPRGSPVLLVRVSLRNPRPEGVPVYWWSNIAVPLQPRTRVVVPADSALAHGYGSGLTCCTVPSQDGEENSYPAALPQARDYFYRLSPDARPWIAALDEAGFGLFQTSTARLRGRKLFAWGAGAGGERWQRFLGTPDYLEIQAGLARTQSHHLSMPAGATWSWIEAYGASTVPPDDVHGRDWARAQAAAAAAIESAMPATRLECLLAESAGWADTSAGELWQCGSGWGALEELRRRHGGEAPLGLAGIRFPAESLGAEQLPWQALLETGRFPPGDPAAGTPGCYMVQPDWHALLGQALAQHGGRHWAALFHHGVMLWNAARTTEAAAAWRESLQDCETPWAAYCLGVAARLAGRGGESLEWLARAHAARPAAHALALPLLKALLDAQDFSRAVKVIRALPEPLRTQSRVRVLEGRALLGAGELDALAHWMADPPVPDDLREGETQLSDIWFGLHEARAAQAAGAPLDEARRKQVRDAHPVPPALDFRTQAQV